LLEGEVPVRLGSRALEILIALVELVSKNELMARVWPDTFVDEGSINGIDFVARKADKAGTNAEKSW
jgi:DNA-binding winged helix-turn-helix (wHTH) protein